MLLTFLSLLWSNSTADFIEKKCDFIEITKRGLSCEFNNILVPELTRVNIVERNTSIDCVSFRQSEIHMLPQDVFAKFPFLKYVDVELSQLKVIKADNFQGAEELKYFLARFNAISSLEKETFLQAPKLKFILLQFNQISYIHPQAFKGLDMLEALYLDDNRLTTLSEHILDYLPSLLHFSMSFNNLTSVHDDLFMKTTRLETLNLGHNLLQHFNDTQFVYMPNLERVHLNHNNFTNLNLVACKSSEINVDENNLEVIELNKWTKKVSAQGNPVKKLILHEHYGAGRYYNFSFNEVSEIVFFVHEHCCTAENLENFELLTQAFGDLSQKGLNTKEWICVFLKSVGYETSNGFVVNNVCTKMNGMPLQPRTMSTSSFIENNNEDNSYDDSQSVLTTTIRSNDTIFDGSNFHVESTTTNNDFELANIEEINSNTTETYETTAEKGIWKSIKTKASGLKESVVRKWNNWIG